MAVAALGYSADGPVRVGVDLGGGEGAVADGNLVQGPLNHSARTALPIRREAAAGTDCAGGIGTFGSRSSTYRGHLHSTNAARPSFLSRPGVRECRPAAVLDARNDPKYSSPSRRTVRFDCGTWRPSRPMHLHRPEWRERPGRHRFVHVDLSRPVSPRLGRRWCCAARGRGPARPLPRRRRARPAARLHCLRRRRPALSGRAPHLFSASRPPTAMPKGSSTRSRSSSAAPTACRPSTASEGASSYGPRRCYTRRLSAEGESGGRGGACPAARPLVLEHRSNHQVCHLGAPR
jgi:hypothetical protein